jgi:hypothetical protein
MQLIKFIYPPDTIIIPSKQPNRDTSTMCHIFFEIRVSNFDRLDFEFLPESLNDFVVHVAGGSKLYGPKNPCKLYTRLGMHEGFQAYYTYVDRTAESHFSHEELAPLVCNECFSSQCCGRVNLFDNTPYALSEDYCSQVDLTKAASAPTLDDVGFASFFYVDTTPEVLNIDSYWYWHGVSH